MIIKPSFCPCCGNTDTFVEPDERGSGGQWIPPIHVGCSVQTGCGLSLTGDDEETAITSWNTRAPIPVTDEMVERGVVEIIDAQRALDADPLSWDEASQKDKADAMAVMRAALTAALGGGNG